MVWEIKYYKFWIFCDQEYETKAVPSAWLLPLFYLVQSQSTPYLQFSNCQSNSVVIQILETLMLNSTKFSCIYNLRSCLMNCFWISSSVHFIELSKISSLLLAGRNGRVVWYIFSQMKALYFMCIAYQNNSVWHHLGWSVGTNILDEPGASIYRISSTLKMEEAGFSETLNL